MRLITWNCQGAFRKKAEFILKMQPDILIVQECEHPGKLKFADAIPKPKDFYWHGDNRHKGIGIFSYSDYTIELLPQFDPKFRYILPLKVSNGLESFTIFAIWAMDDKVDRRLSYVMQIWQAIEHYQDLLVNSTILVGDFNSNTIWDRKGRVGNHSDLVKRLAEKNIHSIYHHKFAAEQGKEIHPTFYLYKNQLKPYHLDYCFVSRDLLDRLVSFDIATYEDWIEHSDHSPIHIAFRI